MTPTAFGLMIVKGALEAGPALLLVVFEEDVDFTVGSAQLHVFDLPGTLDAQNLAVQLAVLHPASLAVAPAPPLETRKSLHSSSASWTTSPIATPRLDVRLFGVPNSTLDNSTR